MAGISKRSGGSWWWLVAVGVAMLGGAAWWGGIGMPEAHTSDENRTETGTAVTSRAFSLQDQPVSDRAEPRSPRGSAALPRPSLPVPLQAADVERLAEAIRSESAEVRIAAIEALGGAPRELALPLLVQIVDTGEPTVDRHEALSALHRLAVEQGDADDRIRTTLRLLIYDGNDVEVSQNAEGILESLDLPRTTGFR